jgi:hypothetical protein
MLEANMNQLAQVYNRHIALMKMTCETIGNVLKNVDQRQAATLKDGPDGWTVLEVLGHLREFDGFFRGRAIMMLEQENPKLPAYDHEALAIENSYNDQSLPAVYTEFSQSRGQTVDFFKGLTDEQWLRVGIHPERGHFTMVDAVMQVGLHDVSHLEQITRILSGGK